MKTSLVSIGLPVHNGGRTIEKVLRSLLGQTYTNIELIVSENCSSDSTRNICSYFASIDTRLKLHLQDKVLTALDNFRYVLNCATGDFFMWAAADDLRDSNFVESCMMILTANPHCAAVTGLERIGNLGLNDKELIGNKLCRLNSFLDYPFSSYGWFYSITRINIARSFALDRAPKLAADWKYVCHLASIGEILRSKDTLAVFDTNGLSHSDQRYSAFRSSSIHWFVPLLDFSKYVMSLTGSETRKCLPPIRKKLAILNFMVALAQLETEQRLAKSKLSRSSYRVAWLILKRLKVLYYAWSLSL